MDDPYFQFPLCLLAFEATAELRLRAVINYCVVNTGAAKVAKAEPSEVSEIVDAFPLERRPQGLHSCPQHDQVIVGMHYLRIGRGSVNNFIERHSAASEFCSEMAAQFGPSPLVRVRTAYAWQVLEPRGMSYWEFAVLCAVYAAIGSKDYPVRITRDRITAGALGYKSPGMLAGEAGTRLLAQRRDGLQPLTTAKVRHLLDTLEAQGHFARVQASKRKVYFSHRLTRDEMNEKLLANATRRASLLRSHREADRDLQKRIQRANEPNRRPSSS